MMKSSKLIAIVVAVIALIWIGSGFLGGSSAEKPPQGTENATQNAQAEEKPLQKVRIREITAIPYNDTIILTGRSHASRSVQLKGEITSVVEKILKEEGARVKKGDMLAILEQQDRAVRKDEAKQRMKQREIEHSAARKLAQKGFNSKVRLAQSRADLEDAKAQLAEMAMHLDNTKIAAPFDGVISEQAIDIGDYVDSGDPLFTIVDLDPLEFVGFVSERRVQELTLNQTAMAELLDGETVTGKISYIAPAANDETRTFRIIVSTDNADNRLKEGLTARLIIPVDAKNAHQISPSILSLNDAGKIGVKIVNPSDIVEFIPVKILADKTDGMWITGVNETARFITVGQDFVVEGQKVEPVPTQGDGLL